jgi:adenylate kinase
VIEKFVRDFYVFLGPPGAGKGTQAKVVAHRLGIPQISSGDLFRENLKNQTEMGIEANKYIKDGELVPDDVTISMIRERISRTDCINGAILDGFPRTSAQARAFDEILLETGCKINKVPYIKVPARALIERLSGRLTCREKGHIFHRKYNPPKEPGVCDFDGSELYQREDDHPETVARRIRVYEEQTRPLIEYYREREVLVEVDGDRAIETITTDLVDLLEMEERDV